MASDPNNASNEIPFSETACSDDGEDIHQKLAAVGLDEDEQWVDMVTFRSASNKPPPWECHPSLFKDRSDLFMRMIEFDTTLGEGPDPCDLVPGIHRVKGPRRSFQLEPSISNSDFESFLWAIKPKLNNEPNLDRLRPMLILATDWKFHDVREYAISKIEGYSMEPADKVALAKRADVAKWVRDPLIAMSVRLAPLDERDTRILGTRVSSAVSRAREAVLRRRLRLLNHQNTGFLVWKWIIWHGSCWETRLHAWRSVLTNEEWWGKSPLEAMNQATKDNFCRECRAELFGWLNLDADNNEAENTMKRHLGNNPSLWIKSL